MKKIFIIISISLAACSSSKKQATSQTTDPQLPICIVHLIDSFKNEPVQNPPRKIYSYTYDNKTVYYIPPVCCDQFSDLITADCELIGHPDGGYTGKGDGKIPDFFDQRKNEKLIWEDERSRNKE